MEKKTPSLVAKFGSREQSISGRALRDGGRRRLARIAQPADVVLERRGQFVSSDVGAPGKWALNAQVSGAFKITERLMAGPFGDESTTDQVLEGVDLRGKRILVTGVSA